MKFRQSLRFKLAFGATLVVLIIVAANLVITLARTSPREHERVITQGKGSAELATQAIGDAYIANSQSLGLQLTTAMRPLAARLALVEYFQIIDLNGKVVYDSRTLKRSVVAETVTDAPLLAAIKGTKTVDFPQSPYRVVVPYFDTPPNHPYSLNYVLNFDSQARLVRATIIQSILFALIFLPGSFFFLYWLAFQLVMKPIDQIRADSNALATGEVDQRIRTRTRDEFYLLAKNINNMAENLTGSITSLQEEKAWKDEFIVLASHNFRTPLNVIMSAVASLQKETNLSPEGRKFVDYIASRGKELHALIENLLSISMLKGEKMKIAKEPFDLIQVINTVAKEHETRLSEKGLKLTLNAPSKQIIINGSEAQIFQVLDNLVDNAIKFTEKGGITVTVSETVQIVTVCVKDTGGGIDSNMVNKLFQSFRRGTEPFSVEKRGSGLGLYFVKLAVEAHNGEVAINSQLGKGTEITIRLPKPTT